MVDKQKKKNRKDAELDLLVDILLSRVNHQMELQKEIARLKLQILTEAEIVARWNKKSFYVS